jgi:hypothetical protein
MSSEGEIVVSAVAAAMLLFMIVLGAAAWLTRN